MAITSALLTGGASAADATSYETASITPSAGKLILLAVTSREAGSDPADTPTISGNGLTWVQVAGRDNTSDVNNALRTTVFRAMGAAPSAGVVTITFVATQRNCVWSVVEFGGVDTSGTNGSGAIGQSANNGADAAASVTVTLAAFGGLNNATYGAFGTDAGATSLAVGTGFTQLHQERAAAEVTRMLTEWRSDNDTSVDASVSAGTTNWAGVAVEIQSADQTVDVGKALETDRALAVAVGIDQTVDVGKAAEHDRALPVSADYTVDVGKAAEHDRALLLTIERAGFPDVPLDALIEFAFGADLAADPSTWTWTAISEPPAGSTEPRLETQSPLSIRRGRADESSAHQPASISFVLRNHDGALTPDNPLSAYWPNVDVGTPCRITLRGLPIAGNPESVRLVGTVDSTEPYWPHQAGGKVRADGAVVSNAYVAVTVNGILRRLGQGAKPLLSALRRQITSEIGA